MRCPSLFRRHVHDTSHHQPFAGVQDHRVQPRAQGRERRGDPAVQRRRVPVEVPDLDPLMQQVIVVRARIRVVRHALGVGLAGGRGGDRDGDTEQDQGQHWRAHAVM